MGTTSKLTYINRKRLSLSLSVLIIKGESIEGKFGSIDDFAVKYDLWGKTNGELMMMAEMMDPPWGLYEIADTILIPNGMVNKQDYLFVYEPLMIGVHYKIAPMFGQPIPKCREIPWLGSMIYCFDSFHEIFVWYKSPVQCHGINDGNPVKRKSGIDEEFSYLPVEMRTMMKQDPLVRLMRDLEVPITLKSYLSEVNNGFESKKINELILRHFIPEWLRLIPEE